LTAHFIGEVAVIARAVPNDRLAIQWDVCQEVLAWEGYYEKGPVDFRTETIAVLTEIGDAVPEAVEGGAQTMPSSLSRFTSAGSRPHSAPSSSAVCSPNSGGRLTSAGESDNLTGQPTVW